MTRAKTKGGTSLHHYCVVTYFYNGIVLVRRIRSLQHPRTATLSAHVLFSPTSGYASLLLLLFASSPHSRLFFPFIIICFACDFLIPLKVNAPLLRYCLYLMLVVVAYFLLFLLDVKSHPHTHFSSKNKEKNGIRNKNEENR